MEKKPILAVVVPCFNEEEVLPHSHRMLSELLAAMVRDEVVAPESRLVLVDDGSTDATWAILQELCASSPATCAIRLAANTGQQNAILAGLETLVEKLPQAHCFITIDADLQDDIRVIPEMIAKFVAGSDVVCGVRDSRRRDSRFKRITAQGFYRLMRRMGVKSIYNHADFRLMSRRAVEQLLRYGERNIFLRGIVPTLGFPTDTVHYDRIDRCLGRSKYTLGKMLTMAVDGITSFSVRPVRMVLMMGVVFVFIALAILAYVLYSKFSGNAESGWASMILSVWFVGGCILIGLGIVGEYIGKIYMEVKGRPRYNITQTLLK